ncbi:TIGR01777 family protein [Acidimicrobiaceae bacterium USS-CC1]|uniref:TIGR01777 family protein n=1 Tax=Acidiferrimicrobium australe TaxID=2664430 RepID=A0ABW9QZU0_9ACTN|nr:TIGR01777 family protein [Acidiferrimicrobium australe]
MKVAVTGSHGLIGRRLLGELRSAGYEVVRLVRSAEGDAAARWDPEAGTVDVARLAGVEAVIHLAGVGIGDRRWNPDHKRAVLDSRIKGTTLIARTVAEMEPRPRVLLSASAIGFYGDRDDELLAETSPSGAGFLADVCRQWEAATAPAEAAGVRTVHLRTGIVQSRDGGALATQLPMFKLGLGARLGRGRQWVSWVSLDDEIRAIRHVLEDESVDGPVNLVGPAPVTNAEYTATLARVLGRPAVLVAPRPAVELALGREMAAELLFVSQRVEPAVLTRTGFSWRHPTLEEALRAELHPR